MDVQSLTHFSLAVDPNGEKSFAREYLTATGGAVSVSGTGEVAITDIVVGKYGYLQRLEVVNTVANSAGGTISILDDAGGNVVHIINVPAVVTVGTRIVVEFPTPVRTGDTGEAFKAQLSANMGTWVVTANGFYSSAPTNG